MRVGGTKLIRTEARIVAATARDLRKEVGAGRFRDDLFYRLNVVPVSLPPLRERAEDIPLLAEHFLARVRGATARGISREAMEMLSRYPWPGDVRELPNVIDRAAVMASFTAGILGSFWPAVSFATKSTTV